jgi:hypothetical protein
VNKDTHSRLNLLYIAGLVALILGGAGTVSIDRLMSREVRSDEVGSTTIGAVADGVTDLTHKQRNG